MPTWTEATAGNWNDRMDIVYGSGAINATRMEHLFMTQPYYYVPQRFVVRADSPYQTPSDLDGKTIGTCSSCTVESYLKGTLEIPGVDLVQKVKDPKLDGFETEAPGIEALAAGELDAFLTAEPVAQQAIDDGMPLRLLDETAFSMYPSGFVDKGSSLSEKAFVDRVERDHPGRPRRRDAQGAVDQVVRLGLHDPGRRVRSVGCSGRRSSDEARAPHGRLAAVSSPR